MPAPVTEFFNGGVVTARHSALLAPGELQRADDCVYRDRDPAIWRAPGRIALNSTALGTPTPIKGLVHASFEAGRDDQIFAYVDTTLLRAPVTQTTPGTFDNLSFSEIGGPGYIAGTIATSTTFTATTGYPFLADIIGSPVFGISVPAGTYVTAVSDQSGATGRYRVVTLSDTCVTGTLNFTYGCVQTLYDSPSGAGTEILDIAQYGNTYFGWFGKGVPRRFSWRSRSAIAGTTYDPTMISRLCGLDPVVTAPTVEVIADATYAWNPTLGTGVYWFLITEAFSPRSDISSAERNPELSSEIVESAYLGGNVTTDQEASVGLPIAATISAVSGFGVRITFPSVVNNGSNGRIASHWCVYMYGPTVDSRSRPSLASLRRIRTVAITTYTAGATLLLTETTTAPQTKLGATTADDDGRTKFTSADSMLTEGGIGIGHAFSKSNSSTDGAYVVAGATKITFTGFTTIAPYASPATIVGIRVDWKGGADDTLANAGNPLDRASYYIHVDTSTKHTTRFTSTATRNRQGVYSTGGQYDTLGVNWALSDLNSITVTIGKPAEGQNQILAVDWVKLSIWFTGGTINLTGPAYRVVTYRDQIGLTVSEPVNLPPPSASTGCFFQGSLVLNDLSDETAIRFSLAGRPEAFPKPYVMRFNTTKRKDRVKYLNTLGPFLLVGLENSIKRVGYLPKETDTDLESGLAHEDIASDHGIPGPFAAVRFDLPGEGTVLAYASISGPFLTNGLMTRPLNIDLDWSNTVKTSALSTCVFKVYPKEKWLVLYYCPAGATHNMNTRALVFSYQADKVKSGGYLPAIGPVVVSARSAVEVMVGGNSYLFTGHESLGKVYQEDSGTTIPSGYQVRLNDNSGVGDGKTGAAVDVKIVPLIRTRKMYPAGIAHDAREERILLLFSPYGATITATGTTTVSSTTITSSAAFGSVLAGMRVKGDNLDPGTIVLSKSNSSTIVVSRAPHTAGSGTLSFDTGTIAASVRGSSVGEAVVGCDTEYGSTLTGDLITFHNDNARQGLELQFEKVPLTFDANHDTATWADLGVNMRLHQFTVLVNDMGTEQNRSTA